MATLLSPPPEASPSPAPKRPRPVRAPASTGRHATPRRSSGAGARRWWNVAAISLIWATSLAILALWVAGGGAQDLQSGIAPALTSLGRITGLVSANLLLYQVLLMARLPVFERGFGRDALVRSHRLIGIWSFSLLLAHVVLVVAGYAIAVSLNPLAQLWEMVLDYPGMLLAAAGTLLIVLVMITSARRARRRMRYESWHLLHLYAYLGIGLAVPHMLWTGGDFLTSPAATAYWWGLWAVALGAAVVFRVVVPLVRSWRHRLTVTSVSPEGHDGVRIRMSGRRRRGIRVRAGQFFVFRFRSGAGWTRGHPYSVISTPGGNAIEIAVRIVGDGTRGLPSLRPGTRVLIEGPYGGMTGELRTGRRLLMLAAGAGVAPLLSLLGEQSYSPGEAVLLVRDHAEADALGRGEIVRLQRTRGLVYAPLPGARSGGASGWLPQSHAAWSGPDLLRYLAPGIDRDGEWDVYVCGPEAWMQSVRADLRAAGLPDRAVHTESFTI